MAQELTTIKVELNNHGKPIASIQGTISYYGITPFNEFYEKPEVDAVLAEKDNEIRKLKRALWVTRADTADSFSCMFRTLEDVKDFDERTYWIFGNKWKIVFSKLKCCLMKTASSWGSIWDTAANKCRAKAEEYK